MAGKHNLQNALAAIAAGLELGANADTIAKALADFSGVKRRFSAVGELGGNIRIFDDYAHHPVEIEAVLESARAVSRGGLLRSCNPIASRVCAICSMIFVLA